MSGISEFFANNDVGGWISGLGKGAGALINTVAPGFGTLVSGAADGIGGALSSNYDRQQQIQAEQRAEQRAIDAENRQEQNQIEAEQRANAEYDRRMADERAYNDPSAQAARMRSAGINPMAALGNTVMTSTSTMSAPNQSTPSLGSSNGNQGSKSRGVNMMSFGEAFQAQTMKNELELQKEEIANVREQTRGDRLNNDLIEERWNEQKKMNESQRNLNKALEDTAKLQGSMYNSMAANYDASSNYIKNVKPWIEGLGVGAQWVASVGILLGGLKGILPGRTIGEVGEKPLEGTLLDKPNTIPDYNPAEQSPMNGPQLPSFGKGLVKGSRYERSADGRSGKYTFDDGSTFEFGLDKNGRPWSNANSPGKFEGSFAEKMQNDFFDYIMKVVKND